MNHEQIPTVMLRLPEVSRRTGLSKATIYRRMKQGGFPRCVSCGNRLVAWIEAEIESYLVKQISSSRDRSPEALWVDDLESGYRCKHATFTDKAQR